LAAASPRAGCSVSSGATGSGATSSDLRPARGQLGPGRRPLGLHAQLVDERLVDVVSAISSAVGTHPAGRLRRWEAVTEHSRRRCGSVFLTPAAQAFANILTVPPPAPGHDMARQSWSAQAAFNHTDRRGRSTLCRWRSRS
jgi:hypothetical protein